LLLIFETFVESVRRSEDRINPRLVEVQCTDGSDTQSPDLSTFNQFQITNLLLAITVLAFDGKSQTKEFQLSVNPNDPVTAAESEEKFVFWMDLYDNIEASTQKVLAALRIKADTLAKVKSLKESGASSAEETEKLAAVVAGIVDA